MAKAIGHSELSIFIRWRGLAQSRKVSCKAELIKLTKKLSLLYLIVKCAERIIECFLQQSITTTDGSYFILKVTL